MRTPSGVRDEPEVNSSLAMVWGVTAAKAARAAATSRGATRLSNGISPSARARADGSPEPMTTGASCVPASAASAAAKGCERAAYSRPGVSWPMIDLSLA